LRFDDRRRGPLQQLRPGQRAGCALLQQLRRTACGGSAAPGGAQARLRPVRRRADFDARIIFATRAEAKAIPRLENRFELVCLKDDYGVERTSPFGAGDAFAAAFLVALAEGAAPDAARERARDAAAIAATLSS
jgi:sugar/nucleoside kinase (ribokinase family)